MYSLCENRSFKFSVNIFHYNRGKPLVWSLCLFLVFYGSLFWQSINWLVPTFIYLIKSPCLFGRLMIWRAYFCVFKKQLILLLFSGAQSVAQMFHSDRDIPSPFPIEELLRRHCWSAKRRNEATANNRNNMPKTEVEWRLEAICRQIESKYGSASFFLVYLTKQMERDTLLVLFFWGDAMLFKKKNI